MEIRTRRPLWGCQRWIFFAFFNDVCRFFFFFNRSICESSCEGWRRGIVLAFWFLHTVCQCLSSLFSVSCCSYRGGCVHIFLVQAVAFSLSHSQGLFIGGHLQNGRLFTGFVELSHFIAFYGSLWSPLEPHQVISWEQDRFRFPFFHI